MQLAVSLIFAIFCKLILAESDPFLYGKPFDESKCNLSESLVEEIKSYQTIARKIYKVSTEGSFQGKAYGFLHQFVQFDRRLTG